MVVRQKDLAGLAKNVAEFAKNHQPKNRAFLLFLDGELGGGKTTFTKHLAKAFGIAQKVLSPTFVLIHEYDIERSGYAKMIHVDAYRLESKTDFKSLRLGDYLTAKQNIIVIEWASRMARWLPKSDLAIRFTHKSSQERILEFSRLLNAGKKISKK